MFLSFVTYQISFSFLDKMSAVAFKKKQQIGEILSSKMCRLQHQSAKCMKYGFVSLKMNYFNLLLGCQYNQNKGKTA